MDISKETKATARSVLWGAAARAIALAIMGFSWGGWMTGGAAETRDEPRCDGCRRSSHTHLR
jgi:hypothetical protein